MEVLNGLMSRLGMTPYALISLVIFFSVFMGIILWIWTRPQKEIEEQSLLWQDDED